MNLSEILWGSVAVYLLYQWGNITYNFVDNLRKKELVHEKVEKNGLSGILQNYELNQKNSKYM